MQDMVVDQVSFQSDWLVLEKPPPQPPFLPSFFSPHVCNHKISNVENIYNYE